MIFIFWVVLAVLAALIHLGRTRGEERAPGEVAGIFLRYWLGIAVGIAGLVGAGFHIFDGEQIAKEICFTRGDGGFQFENAMGDVAIGVVGVLSMFIRNPKFWLAVVIVTTIQYWGDAYGHVYQMIVNDNHCEDNTGLVLWADIWTPLVAIVLYVLMRRGQRSITT
ncbi:MAG: hypothetical protein FGM38_01325 [Solirubrobacterales bacterium]|nr:hypothetical protein [Solirubrobacterales bacterium]